MGLPWDKVVAGTEIPGGGGKKEARPNSALCKA